MTDSLRAQADTPSHTVQEQIAEAARKSAAKGRRELADRLNHAVRGLIQAETTNQWKEIFLDAVAAFCDRVALFRVSSEDLILEASRGLSNKNIVVKRSSAPALTHAIDLRETIVAACVPSELSPEIAAIGDEGTGKVYLVPVRNGDNVPGIVVTAGVTEQSAIELLANVAGLTLQTIQSHTTGIANIAPAVTKSQVEPSVPSWTSFPRETQQLHARAQRFARRKIAEMQLHHASAVQAGRRMSNLYSSLQPQIDAAREQFKEEFANGEREMTDYLHAELVSTLANDDEILLGADYPGPLA